MFFNICWQNCVSICHTSNQFCMYGYLSMRSRTRARQKENEQLHNTGHTVTVFTYYSTARKKESKCRQTVPCLPFNCCDKHHIQKGSMAGKALFTLTVHGPSPKLKQDLKQEPGDKLWSRDYRGLLLPAPLLWLAQLLSPCNTTYLPRWYCLLWAGSSCTNHQSRICFHRHFHSPIGWQRFLS